MNQLIANYYKPWLNARMNSCVVDGDFTVNGSVVHHDVVVINDDLIVNGQTVHNGNVTASNNFFVLANSTTENLAVNNEANVIGPLNVTGLTTLNNLTVNGTVTHHGPYVLNNNLLVTGTTTTENLVVNNETNLLGVLNTSGLATFETVKVNIEATIEDLIVESELIVNGITQTDAIINNTSIETEDLQVNNSAQVDGTLTCNNPIICAGISFPFPSETLNKYDEEIYTGTVGGTLLVAPTNVSGIAVRVGKLFTMTVDDLFLDPIDMNPGGGLDLYIDFTFNNGEVPANDLINQPIIMANRGSANFIVSRIVVTTVLDPVVRFQIYYDINNISHLAGPANTIVPSFTISWRTV